MKRIPKWILQFLAVVTVLSVISLLAWYAVFFLPNLNKLKFHAAAGVTVVAPVINQIYPLAVASEGERGLRIGAVRYAYSSVRANHGEPTVRRHLNELLWFYASQLHFSEREIFGLWVNCVLLGCDKGLPKASWDYYGQEIRLLSYRELAGLVVLTKAPNAYKPGSERSERRIQAIIDQVKTHNITLQKDAPKVRASEL